MAEKKLRFKDFLTVDYAPGMPEVIKKKAKQRKQQDVDEAFPGENETLNEALNEVLNMQQRRARGRQMRINAPKIKMGRKRAMMRQADPARLKRRAEKAARMVIFKKFSKGLSRSDVPPQRRMEIEKRLDKMKSRIQRLAIKLLPQIRQKEKDRRSHSQDDTDKKTDKK
jgi:hypothetical protein